MVADFEEEIPGWLAFCGQCKWSASGQGSTDVEAVKRGGKYARRHAEQNRHDVVLLQLEPLEERRSPA